MTNIKIVRLDIISQGSCVCELLVVFIILSTDCLRYKETRDLEVACVSEYHDPFRNNGKDCLRYEETRLMKNDKFKFSLHVFLFLHFMITIYAMEQGISNIFDESTYM